MGVVTSQLVFDVVARLRDLAQVVVVAANADEQRVCADQVGGPFAKVADDDAVVERSRRLVLQLAQQGRAELCQLHELHPCGDAEEGAERDIAARRQQTAAEAGCCGRGDHPPSFRCSAFGFEQPEREQQAGYHPADEHAGGRILVCAVGSLDGVCADNSTEAVDEEDTSDVDRLDRLHKREVRQADDGEHHQACLYQPDYDREAGAEQRGQQHRCGGQRQEVGDKPTVIVGQDEREVQFGQQHGHGDEQGQQDKVPCRHHPRNRELADVEGQSERRQH